MCILGSPRSWPGVTNVSTSRLFGRRSNKHWQGVRKWDWGGKEGNRRYVNKQALQLNLAGQVGETGEQRSANFSYKGQRVNISGFGSHGMSVTTTQFCHCSQRQYVNEWICLCLSKTLFAKPGSQSNGCSLSACCYRSVSQTLVVKDPFFLNVQSIEQDFCKYNKNESLEKQNFKNRHTKYKSFKIN